MTAPLGAPPDAATEPPGEGATLQLGWIRRMWPVLRPHRALVVGSFAVAIVSLALQVAVPAIVGRTIDSSISGPSTSGADSPLQPFLVALVVIALVRGLLVVVYRYGLFRMAYSIEADLRSSMYPSGTGGRRRARTTRCATASPTCSASAACWCATAR